MERHDAKYLPLAALGAAGGIWKYYVQPELKAHRAWTAIGLGVLAYEVACPRGELLSEGVDRAIERHPVATLGSIALVAAHLANLIPNQIDPIHQMANVLGRYKDGSS